MLAEEIESIDLTDDLGIDDLKVIQSAKNLLASAPILNMQDFTNDTKVWYSSNIECQTKLENLKSRVDTLKWRKYYNASSLEGEILKSDPDLKDEYRSREDRLSVMLYSDSTLKDLRLTEKRLDSISGYVSSLIWGLRNITSVLTMRN